MKFRILIFFTCVIATESVIAEQAIRNSNIFNLNGENVRIEDNVLKELRDEWKNDSLTKNSSVPSPDIQWTLDYIAVSEVINSYECKSKELLEIRGYDENFDTDKVNSNIVSELFDEVWIIKVCDEVHKYRVVHIKGKQGYAVYPIEL